MGYFLSARCLPLLLASKVQNFGRTGMLTLMPRLSCNYVVIFLSSLPYQRFPLEIFLCSASADTGFSEPPRYKAAARNLHWLRRGALHPHCLVCLLSRVRIPRHFAYHRQQESHTTQAIIGYIRNHPQLNDFRVQNQYSVTKRYILDVIFALQTELLSAEGFQGG